MVEMETQRRSVEQKEKLMSLCHLHLKKKQKQTREQDFIFFRSSQKHFWGQDKLHSVFMWAFVISQGITERNVHIC